LIVHLEVVVGKQVRDVDGRTVGRLEDVYADWRGEECIVTHYALVSSALIFVLRLLGARKTFGTIIVPWNKLDFSDPSHPRLNCRFEDLHS